MKVRVMNAQLLAGMRNRLRSGVPPVLLWGTLLLAVCVASSPPGILVVLGSPQTVRTTNTKVGVHTRLSDEVEEWKVQRTLALAREMGASWVV
ncbi:MAG: hypothetical protein J7M17_00705, partial [Anaerolineae bacterium]|nr:hypothetical protein [Anaerolineae bacterium]